jgi:DNA (cytosine-5)-methyltransferase 1
VEGESIFSRQKPLVDATLMRIIAGIERFVINGDNDFMLKYNSMSQRKTYVPPSVDAPCPTISCQDRIGLVKAKFMSQAFSGRPADKNFTLDRPAKTITTVDHHQLLTAYYGNGYNSSIEEPCRTVTTKDRFALVTSKFQSIMTYNSPGLNTPITEPCGTVTTKDRFALVTSKFMDQQYGMSKPSSILQPAGTVTANPKLNLVSAQWLMDTQFKNIGCSLKNPCPTITANRKHFYLMNPQFANKGGNINRPCFTLIARMDKAPPYLIETTSGNVEICINPDDTEIMIQLKTLCNTHGIIDVRMRMLLIEELLRIQGFGDTYKLCGTQADKKKFIGNAVECNQARVLAEAIAGTINVTELKMAI